MAYVPPHKRAGASSVPPPLPSPCSSGKKRTTSNRRGGNPLFRVDIKSSPTIIKKWFVVGLPEDCYEEEALLLKSYPFQSYIHLQNENLFQLVPAYEELEAKQRFESFASPLDPPQKIHDMIVYDLRNLNMIKEGRPKFFIRLGKTLFHRFYENPPEKVSERFLAVGIKRGVKCLKTFETGIQHGNWTDIKEKSFVTSMSQSQKERYTILVKDKSRSRGKMFLMCEKRKDIPEKIYLRKIKSEPIRHFVCDISCVYKPIDVRVMLYSVDLVNFTDEEMECLKNIVESARVQEDQMGGLHFPLGKESVGRFEVIGTWHRKITIFDGNSWLLKMQSADRVDYEASAGRNTWEAEILIKDFNKYLLGHIMDDGRLEEYLRCGLRHTWQLL